MRRQLRGEELARSMDSSSFTQGEVSFSNRSVIPPPNNHGLPSLSGPSMLASQLARHHRAESKGENVITQRLSPAAMQAKKPRPLSMLVPTWVGLQADIPPSG